MTIVRRTTVMRAGREPERCLKRRWLDCVENSAFYSTYFRCLLDMVSRATGSTSMFIQATKERGNKRRITGGKADMSRLDMAMAETARRWVKNSFSDSTYN